MKYIFSLAGKVINKFGKDNVALIVKLLHDKCIYQAMWQLRHLERALNKEDGVIRIMPDNKTTPFEITGFSLPLKILIEEELDGLDFELEYNAAMKESIFTNDSQAAKSKIEF